MKNRIVLILLLASWIAPARAENGSDANSLQAVLLQQQQMLQEQQKMLQQMQAKIGELESRQASQSQAAEPNVTQLASKVAALQEAQAQTQRQQEAMSNKVEMVANKEPELPKGIEWVKNVKINGDLRYRFETIEAEGSHNNTRNRIRARLGLTAKVSDDVDAGFRIATDQIVSGGKDFGDPVSTNQTMGNGFGKDPIWLDLAYFVWHPKEIAGLNVYGGKMENPFYRVGNNQLIWDGDLTPEGIAVKYTKSISGSDDVFVNAGGFWASQNGGNPFASDQPASVGLWGLQGGLTHKFEDKSALTGGLGYYTYGNIQGSGPLTGTSFFGNSNADNKYLSDYGIAEIFGQYDFTIGERPSAVFANFVNNTQSSTGKDTGYLVGASYGKLSDPGTWQLSYDYRDIEADAVVGAFNDSDFIGGGTNGKGHRIGVTYQMTKNIQTGLNYFMNKRGDDNRDYNRLQADLMFKF